LTIEQAENILMNMKTTINIDDQLLQEATQVTGVQEIASLVRMGLETLIYHEAAKRLAALQGTDPLASTAPRKRPWNRKG